MNKVVKISSNQGGSFTANNNLCDFDFSDGVYDLSKSYVNLVSNITSQDAEVTQGIGIYMPILNMNLDDLATPENVQLHNIALVKNMSMSCANKGQISDIRRVDVLRSNLNNYKLSSDEIRSLNYQSVLQPAGLERQRNSIYREIRKEGSDTSRNVEAGIRIPLSQLCNFGKVQQYDANKYGKTRLHLELNIDKVAITQFLGNNNGAGAPTNNWIQGDARNSMLNLENAVGGNTRGIDTTKLFTTNQYRNLEDTPFWVGQKIRVSGTAVGTAPALANVVRRIVSIEFVRGALAAATDSRVMLTLNAPLVAAGLTAGQGYNTMTVDGDTCTFNNGNGFQVDYAELVLTKVMSPSKSSPSITYSEFSTEEHNANGVQRFQRQFQLEPEAFNVYIMRNSLAANGGIFSRAADVTQWRLRMNNEDLTNRNILIRTPLAYDRLNMTLANTGDKLHNLNERGRNMAIADDAADNNIVQYQKANQQQLIIANPLYVTPTEKMLQVNITSTTASLRNMCIFKECVREL